MKNKVVNMLIKYGAEILDMSDKNFKTDFLLAINSVGGCTDYRNDRERPYDGQPHTDFGIRGKTFVEGLTFRDICDCICKGFLIAAGKHSILELPLNEWEKLWIKTDETDEFGDVIFKPTDEMIERLKKNEFVGDKIVARIWRYNDLYDIENDFDPIAVIQCIAVEIEKMMGIFPNIKRLED